MVGIGLNGTTVRKFYLNSPRKSNTPFNRKVHKNLNKFNYDLKLKEEQYHNCIHYHPHPNNLIGNAFQNAKYICVDSGSLSTVWEAKKLPLAFNWWAFQQNVRSVIAAHNFSLCSFSFRLTPFHRINNNISLQCDLLHSNANQNRVL